MPGNILVDIRPLGLVILAQGDDPLLQGAAGFMLTEDQFVPLAAIPQDGLSGSAFVTGTFSWGGGKTGIACSMCPG